MIPFLINNFALNFSMLLLTLFWKNDKSFRLIATDFLLLNREIFPENSSNLTESFLFVIIFI